MTDESDAKCTNNSKSNSISNDNGSTINNTNATSITTTTTSVSSNKNSNTSYSSKTLNNLKNCNNNNYNTKNNNNKNTRNKKDDVAGVDDVLLTTTTIESVVQRNGSVGKEDKNNTLGSSVTFPTVVKIAALGTADRAKSVESETPITTTTSTTTLKQQTATFGVNSVAATTVEGSTIKGCQFPLPLDSLNNGRALETIPAFRRHSTATTGQFGARKAMAAVISASLGSSAAAATPPTAHLGAGVSTVGSGGTKNDIGVIDYTINANAISASASASASIASPASSTSSVVAAAAASTLSSYMKHSNNTTSNCNDIGRHPISSAHASGGFGGRLQFFKDGKFILELARSKDSEKGWVSVPRKLFRTPSATSSTVTPTSVTASSYPKNESSTSLSFSDDNSSIQSSPWQRDHCWKQSTPRHGISKEMSLWYRRSKGQTLTKKGFYWALRKRRRPYDNTHVAVDEVFMPRRRATELQNHNADDANHIADADVDGNGVGDDDDDDANNATLKADELAKATVQASDDVEVQQESRDDNAKMIDEKCNTTATTTTESSVDHLTISDLESKKNRSPNDVKSDKCQQQERQQHDGDDVDGKKTVTSMNKSVHTSDDDKMNEDSDMDKSMQQPQEQQHQCNGNVEMKNKDKDLTKQNANSKSEIGKLGEEKRLTKSKTNGAKLSVIIQKLIDRMPTRVIAAKTPLPPLGSNSAAAGGINANNSQIQKVSPPTSSAPATSRLVEYHQQHVSPRKRILRELEKVSLEDNAAGAGGKRSRAKASNNQNIGSAPILPVQYQNSNPSTYPSNRTTSTTTAAAAAATTNNEIAHASITNGNHYGEPLAVTPKSKLLAPNSTTTPTPTTTPIAAPTRLYSSYSIHSLLSGSSSSSSSNNASNSSTKPSGGSSGGGGGGIVKKENDVAVVSNIASNYAQHRQSSASATSTLSSPYADPSYLRTMLVSPKSPDGGNGNVSYGGKSPSHMQSYSVKKRSPPYISPLHDVHSRSPTVASHAGGGIDYGQRSPRATPPEVTALSSNLTSNYKVRFPAKQEQHHARAPSPTNATHNYSATTPSHHSHHLQHHHGFYSPFMMSPKYVPAPSVAAVPSGSNASTITQSPRQASAFSSTSSASPSASASAAATATAASAAASATPQHIPNTNSHSHCTSSNAVSSIAQGDLSPPRSTAGSPRETKPRTVPKKTASIRRQFASSSSSSPTMAANTNSTSSSSSMSPSIHLNSRGNCLSPSDRNHCNEPLQSHSISHSHSQAQAQAQQQYQQQQQQQQQQERKNPHLSNATSPLLQRSSPLGAGSMGGGALPLHYYMYPPATSGSVSPHASPAAAAAAAAYIPSVAASNYYHQYLSLMALRNNSMWMHHYPRAVSPVLPSHLPPGAASVTAPAVAAAAAAAAAARLSPPFGFYNPHVLGAPAPPPPPPPPPQPTLHGGVNLGMLTAASSAQDGKYADTTSDLNAAIKSNHLHHHQHHVQQQQQQQEHQQQQQHHHPHSSSQQNEHSLGRTINQHGNNAAITKHTTVPATATSAILYPVNDKVEPSSDVPLNLSKH